METEVKLVHPNDPEKKVVTALTGIQVEAYKNNGFVEESELAASHTQSGEATSNSADAEELARLKAEVKTLKSENTKLRNKLEKVGSETSSADAESETNDPETGEQPVGEKDETK